MTKGYDAFQPYIWLDKVIMLNRQSYFKLHLDKCKQMSQKQDFVLISNRFFFVFYFVISHVRQTSELNLLKCAYLKIVKQMCWRRKQFAGCLELVWQNKWERAIRERSKLFG